MIIYTRDSAHSGNSNTHMHTLLEKQQVRYNLWKGIKSYFFGQDTSSGLFIWNRTYYDHIKVSKRFSGAAR